MADQWQSIATAPSGVWLETMRKGEDGTNECAKRVDPAGDVEWIERSTGRTTVTHHSFLPPTHWRRK